MPLSTPLLPAVVATPSCKDRTAHRGEKTTTSRTDSGHAYRRLGRPTRSGERSAGSPPCCCVASVLVLLVLVPSLLGPRLGHRHIVVDNLGEVGGEGIGLGVKSL